MKKIINVVTFIVMIVLGRLWIAYDQDFLPSHLLLPAFILVMLLLMVIYFFFVKPEKAMKFARTLSFIIVAVVAVLSLLQHLIIQNDFNTIWMKSVLIWGISFVMPYCAAILYKLLRSLS
jgi:hypothetical protein